nr:clavaminate synthase-like protein At3g21360 [Ipomoea batatas]
MDRMDTLLHQSGAILFKGFSVNLTFDFNDVVEAFGYEELPYDSGGTPRTNVVGRVFTANELPPDQKIPFQHEMARNAEKIKVNSKHGMQSSRKTWSRRSVNSNRPRPDLITELT